MPAKTSAMPSIFLKEGSFSDDFYPFTLTRPVADIRCGIMTIREKWACFFPLAGPDEEAIPIPSNVLPDEGLLAAIRRGDPLTIEQAIARATRLEHSMDILRLNEQEIRRDLELIARDRQPVPVPGSNRVILPVPEKQEAGASIFIEPGAVVEHCFLNASAGPIYIGKNALVMEGSMIRGPFALGEGAVLKMGAKIYGATSIGPFSVVGGEVKHSVIFGYSNKAHDGYLGDSVVGEWCNLGGGTSVSNMKNHAGPVKLWNPLRNSYLDAGIKCGLFMGDYSRSAINSSFNTGAVVGVSVNVFGKGLTPSYLSSFTWGYDPAETYDLDRAIRHIRRWKQLKNRELSEQETERLRKVFTLSV
jgi:UDP-N-acetylglucosamine diphosphorylase/glucosamine-1-phosphate N-acetyltransferase